MAASDNEALEAEIGITLNKLTRQLAQAEARMIGAAKKAEDRWKQTNTAVAASFRTANTSANSFANGGLRMVMMQFSQVAQQGAATGDWVKALTIQAPDLALGFGAVGIAVGALTAVFGPMIVDLLGGSDAAKQLQDDLKGLEAAVGRLETAQKRLGQGRLKLSEQYGGLSEEARQLFEIDRQIAEIQARGALEVASRGIAGGLGVADVFGFDPAEIRELEASMKAIKKERDQLQAAGASGLSDVEFQTTTQRIKDLQSGLARLKDVSRNLDDLADLLGINEAQAREVAAQFAAIGQADGPETQARALIELVDYISRASDNLANAEEEGEDLYDALRKAAIEALGVVSAGIASEISAGADEAERLAKNLALAKQGQVLVDAARNNPDFYDPRGESRTSASRDPNEYSRPLGLPEVVMPPNPTTKKKGRSGGGASEADKELNRLLRERDAILRDLETAQDRYNAKLADLDKLRDMGELGADEYQAALDRLNQELASAEYANVIRGIDGISRSMADALMNSENLGDGVRNMLRSVAAEIVASDIKSLLMDAFGFGGGGGGSILASLFKRRAAGGSAQAGQPYIVNENTARSEVFVPGQNGAILSASQAMRSLGGSASRAQSVDVQVHGGDLVLTDSGQIAARIAVSARQARAGAVQDVRASYGDMQSEYHLSGVLT